MRKIKKARGKKLRYISVNHFHCLTLTLLNCIFITICEFSIIALTIFLLGLNFFTCLFCLIVAVWSAMKMNKFIDSLWGVHKLDRFRFRSGCDISFLELKASKTKEVLDYAKMLNGRRIK